LQESIFDHLLTIVSFICPDPWDYKAFGYIVSENRKNVYYGFRTERPAFEVENNKALL